MFTFVPSTEVILYLLVKFVLYFLAESLGKGSASFVL